MVQIESIRRRKKKKKVTEKLKCVKEKVENIVGKGENAEYNQIIFQKSFPGR